MIYLSLTLALLMAFLAGFEACEKAWGWFWLYLVLTIFNGIAVIGRAAA